MKFTLSWLKDYLDTTATIDEICDGLIGVGLEVEEVSDNGRLLKDFTVAHVTLAEKHPNADKLRQCVVETKDGVKQVVCGAPNARTGIKAIIALPGVTIPATGAVFSPATIRGVESQAMLCSERELLISDEHNGIIEVDERWPVGTPAAMALGLDDPMIYVKVTPNRPDALGIYGIARDLAAKGLGKLKPLDAKPVTGTFESPIKVSLDFPDGDTKPCPLFVGRYIKGVKNGPSPQWLQRRLHAIGLRPISTLVDITNYITFAYGRPLHVFDAAKVSGNIRARMAKDGETLEALDNKTYTLTSAMTVIADDAGPEAIAGIIGGVPSSCTEETTEVFLEAAYFDPLRTAATGRKLGITSDARYRFERGVDPAFTPTGAEIATRMILDLCGGEASHIVMAGAVPNTSRIYSLRKSRVASLAGADIPVTSQKAILNALGYGVNEMAETLDCAVPSWRPDIHGEADLVEEVCRIYGLDNIAPAPMERPSAIAKPVLNPLQKRMLSSRRTLATRGFNEAITWAFLPEDHAKLFGGGQPELKLANPISSELSDMRSSLLPNLIAAAGRNIDRGFADMMLAEVGHAYAGDQPKDETLRAAGIRRGAFMGRNVHGGARSVDAYDAKADALAVLEAAGAPVANVQVVAGAPSWYHPGRSGTIQMGPQNKLAYFGEIHPRVLAAMDVKGPLVAFEVILNAVPGSKSKSATRAALNTSDLLPLSRDFAFVVDDTVEAEKLVKAAKGADKALISDVTVFDLYKLDGGKTSLALEVTLQPRDKTLTEPEIEAVSAKIVAAVTKATGGTLKLDQEAIAPAKAEAQLLSLTQTLRGASFHWHDGYLTGTAMAKTDTRKAFADLKAHLKSSAPTDMRKAFARDAKRFDTLSAKSDDLLLDYSKCAVSTRTMKLLSALAKAADVEGKRDQMFDGAIINTTEDRAVLHTALRNRANTPVMVDGRDVMPDVNAVLAAMAGFAREVRSSKITDVVNIGIGGSDLGPAMTTLALAPYHDGPRLHYVSNVDGAHIADTLKTLNPETTLFLIASKTFTTIETMTNARTARKWIAEKLGEDKVGDHFAAISTAIPKVKDFGISEERIFGFWDWVGGRYSIWSAIGLAVMIAIGPENFGRFLDGGHAMDMHFREAPILQNLPMLMGLIGVWHRNVCGHPSRAIIPYDQRLSRFAAYLQQLDMESNGKRVTKTGAAVKGSTGPIVWGEPGTNGQHAFFQLLHQGTDIIPVEFLIAAEPHEAGMPEHHALLVANCLAQSQALMKGRTLKEAETQLLSMGKSKAEAKALAPHRVFTGNRPSITLAYRKLDPFTLGRLIALYEHRVFVEAAIWNINAFDQWGVELGKELATGLQPVVEGKKSTEGLDASTAGLSDYLRGLR